MLKADEVEGTKTALAKVSVCSAHNFSCLFFFSVYRCSMQGRHDKTTGRRDDRTTGWRDERTAPRTTTQ